jgi:hypothetical protein
MQSIGTNSIRVYHVNPYADHDGCMAAFDNAGIYVWLDLDTFSTQINQSAPTWETDQFLAFAEVMDVFQKYDNLAGFWIGNEVINTETGSIAAPYIKAATTDMKSYMADKSYRQIPIGYSAADIAELRPMLQNYLACGSQPNQIIDFFGLNSYEWCGDATYQSSGYENLQAMSEGYNIPIFFSETGCIIPAPRTFADQAAIFGPDMIDTWSGAIIYEWVQEVNDYGLVTYPNGQIYSGAPIPLQPDYNNLANQWKNINPTGVSEASYSPSLSPPACPQWRCPTSYTSCRGSRECCCQPSADNLDLSICSNYNYNFFNRYRIHFSINLSHSIGRFGLIFCDAFYLLFSVTFYPILGVAFCLVIFFIRFVTVIYYISFVGLGCCASFELDPWFVINFSALSFGLSPFSISGTHGSYGQD